MEALKDPQEAEGALELFNHFYYEEEQGKDPLRKIVAYLFLAESSSISGGDDIPRFQKADDIDRLIKSLRKEDLLSFSKQITSADIKKGFVNLIRKYHPEYTNILVGILFEVPVKINRYVFGLLVDEKKFAELNLFIETVLNRSKEYPEVFLWVAKSILTSVWDYEWLKVSTQDLVLRVFRLLKPLVKIEEKGTKLKNATKDILFENDNGDLSQVLIQVIKEGDSGY
ncbi:MAG: transcription elongation factor GreA, partial [Leptospira sp.]|nr:transcription elongation factor GreA [Leptospira sp.]